MLLKINLISTTVKLFLNEHESFKHSALHMAA